MFEKSTLRLEARPPPDQHSFLGPFVLDSQPTQTFVPSESAKSATCSQQTPISRQPVGRCAQKRPRPPPLSQPTVLSSESPDNATFPQTAVACRRSTPNSRLHRATTRR